MAAQDYPETGPSGAEGARPARAPDAHQRVGVFLRQMREARGLSLDDVSTVLRIRESHIGAIEDGRFRDLPGSTYATGFVRSYARYLDLDETAVVERFKDEVAAVEAEAELVLPYATRERRFPSPAVLVASVLVAAVVYGAWHILSGAEQKAGAPDYANEAPSVPAAPAADTPSGEPGGASVVPTDETQPAAPARPAAKPANDKASFDQRTNAGAVASAGAGAKTASGAEALVAADSDIMFGPDDGRPRVLIRALNDSWIQLTDASGSRMVSHILRKGEDFAIPDRPGVRLTVGNTGTVRLVVDGKVLPALGPDGTVRRNIALDPDKLAALH
ncbi:MAG: helix-turn-helix domain-containing protein [Candidatus Eiseniibacteriota bacterium]